MHKGTDTSPVHFMTAHQITDIFYLQTRWNPVPRVYCENPHHVREVETSTLVGKVPETLHPCSRNLNGKVVFVWSPEQADGVPLTEGGFRLSGPDTLRAQRYYEQCVEQHGWSLRRRRRRTLLSPFHSHISNEGELLTTITNSHSQRCTFDNISVKIHQNYALHN